MSSSPFRALNGNSTPIASPVFMRNPTFDSPTWDTEPVPLQENGENSAPLVKAHSSNNKTNSLDWFDSPQPTIRLDEQHRSPSLKKIRTGGTPQTQINRRSSTKTGTSSTLGAVFSDPLSDNHENNKTMNLDNNMVRLSDEHKDVRFASPRHYSAGSRLTQVQVLEQEQMAKDPRFASVAHSNLARRINPGASPLSLSKMTSPNAAAASFSSASSVNAEACKRRSSESALVFNITHDCLPFSEPTPVLLAPVFPLVEASKNHHEHARQTKSTDGSGRRHSEMPNLQPSSSQDSSTSSSAHSNGSGHSNWTAGTSSSSAASSMASTLVKRMMTTDTHTNTSFSSHTSSAQSSASASSKVVRGAPRHPHRTTVRGTPVRIKPRVRREDVQATDSGYASVAKLSAWLADDPTSNKKVVTVRRGANVINKSRRFEKDLEDVIVEEVSLKRGSTKEKKQWLSQAFSDDDEDAATSTETQSSVGPFTRSDCGFGNRVSSNHDCAASTISVSNKKQWLANAFKSSSSEVGNARGGLLPRVAQSDIGPAARGRDLDQAGSRAKLLWQKKSEQRLLSPDRKPPKPVAKSSPWRGTPQKGHGAERPLTRSSVPNLSVENKPAPRTPQVQRHSVAGTVVEEDTTQIDFRAARALLIQRSKHNGNEVKVASKMQRRMDKFEKLGQDNLAAATKQKIVPHKSMWNPNKSTGGEEADVGPSDSYTRAVVPDIAPKRSFEELP